MITRRAVVGVTAVLLAATGCGGAAATPPADLAAGPDRIAFTRWATPGTGQPELWTGNIDGSDLAPVGGRLGGYLEWSSDRTYLLFEFVDEQGDNQVATIRPDGTGLTVLTNGPFNGDPAQSPDGSTIVFERSVVGEDHPDFALTLWNMDSDGANARPLLDPGKGALDSDPTVRGDYEGEYSPDGSMIVFTRFDADTDAAAVHVMNSDGSDVRRLTDYDTIVEHPRWSPDGATIVYNIEYQQDLDDPRNGIWQVPAVGGDATLLLATDEELHGFKPDYSPDGSRILFGCLARTDGTDELCVMNADGTDVQRITRTPTFENHPVWD